MTKKPKDIKTIADLTPDGENFNKHTEFGTKLLEDSLRKFGAGRSILVDKDGNIIAGNGVVETAAAIGMEDVVVVKTDGKKLVVVQRDDLTLDSPQGREMALADNMTALHGIDIDLEKVKEHLGEDLAKAWGMEIPEVQKHTQEDDFDPDKPVETVCKKGDIWKLGSHRLMCGDSTNAEDFDRLMDGNRADLSFTSPPYNAGCLDLEGRENTKRKYMNDADTKTDEQYLAFLSANVELLLKHSDEVFYNIGVVAGSKVAILGLLYEYRDKFKDFIYWKKNNPVNCIAKGVISSAVELIMCFGENNSRAFKDTHFQNGEYYLGVIEGNVASNNEYAKIHKATFPMYLPENIIKNFSSKGSSILDCFGGTGTTMIAAEQLNRKCYMMELDPHYCDVIIARWEKLTGNKAERISNGND